MDQIHLYAYEALGMWNISVKVTETRDDGEMGRSDIYRGTHVAIDEQDPLVRTVLILHQVYTDLNQALMGELDTLADRPPHH